MFHTPAHKQTSPGRLPGQVRLSDSTVAAMERLNHPALTDECVAVERACSTCVHQHLATSKEPCHSCLPNAVTLPGWTTKAAPLASRPDPCVKAIEALQRIFLAVQQHDAHLDDENKPGGAQAPTGDDYNEIVEIVRSVAGPALAAVAQQQATDFVPVTGETLVA